MNKVKYGLKNVYYAKLTEGASSDTYATPTPWPGAVNLSLSPVGEKTSFVADDVEYFTAMGNNGYDGDLECALLPETFASDIMGETEDADKVQHENTNAAIVPFALLFEFSGDANQIKHLFFKCTAARANVEGTATVNKDVKTTKLSLQCRPNRNGYVKANTKSDTLAAAASGWYTAVHTFKTI